MICRKRDSSRLACSSRSRNEPEVHSGCWNALARVTWPGRTRVPMCRCGARSICSSRLVLPLPLGPITATRSPGVTVNDTLRNTTSFSRHKVRLFATTSGPDPRPEPDSRRVLFFSTLTSARRRSSAALSARRSAASARFICRFARLDVKPLSVCGAFSFSRLSAPARRVAATRSSRAMSCFNAAFSTCCRARRCRKPSRQAENDVRSTSTVSRFNATMWSQQASRKARSWETSRKPGLERR